MVGKKNQVNYYQIIRNHTFSDVHRNPKKIGTEYFEFEKNSFTYSFARKLFDDQYYRRTGYQGIFVIIDDTIILTIKKMLFYDKDVIGYNKPTKNTKNGDEAEETSSYSFYDINLLRSKGLIDGHKFEMPTKFRIIKNASSTKIVALNGEKGKIFEAKKPLNY